jgi:hypothetical protein
LTFHAPYKGGQSEACPRGNDALTDRGLLWRERRCRTPCECKRGFLGDDVAIEVTKGSTTALGEHQVARIVEDPDVLIPPMRYALKHRSRLTCLRLTATVSATKSANC